MVCNIVICSSKHGLSGAHWLVQTCVSHRTPPQLGRTRNSNSFYHLSGCTVDVILKASSSSSSPHQEYFVFMIYISRSGSGLKFWLREIRDSEETEVAALSDITSIKPGVGSVSQTLAEIKTKTATILNICDSLQRCVVDILIWILTFTIYLQDGHVWQQFTIVILNIGTRTQTQSQDVCSFLLWDHWEFRSTRLRL